MSDIEKLTKSTVQFRDARDWKKFHNAKDASLSLILEAAELLEHFQWKNEKEISLYVKSNRGAIGEELADVLYFVLIMSHDLGVDIKKAFVQKMKKNEKKYPVSKVRGKHKWQVERSAK